MSRKKKGGLIAATAQNFQLNDTITASFSRTDKEERKTMTAATAAWQ